MSPIDLTLHLESARPWLIWVSEPNIGWQTTAVHDNNTFFAGEILWMQWCCSYYGLFGAYFTLASIWGNRAQVMLVQVCTQSIKIHTFGVIRTCTFTKTAHFVRVVSVMNVRISKPIAPTRVVVLRWYFGTKVCFLENFLECIDLLVIWTA